jgi:hypothetical protein
MMLVYTAEKKYHIFKICKAHSEQRSFYAFDFLFILPKRRTVMHIILRAGRVPSAAVPMQTRSVSQSQAQGDALMRDATMHLTLA